MNSPDRWKRYQEHLCACPAIGLRLDISRMMFDEKLLDRMGGPMGKALSAMRQLEGGGKANVDEDRMVGHYWLRAPDLAPIKSIRNDIEQAVANVKRFADDVHAGNVKPQRDDGFYVVLVIGIGGSALGPQLLCDALGGHDDPMIVRFIDNTDPDGIDRVLGELDEMLGQTLTVVVTKSGTTIETQNGMRETARAYERAGLDFARHAVAITCPDSALHKTATRDKWLGVFPLWDWVGGRTSIMSAVGLLPAALLGVDVEALLCGARDCDVATREPNISKNPAALLASMWHYAGGGKGSRDMVVLPYRDRLGLLSRYLQQLVMESLGKKLDRAGQVVHQGLTVYGNKGTTDQHALVQQLLDGPDDFFVTFVTVQQDRASSSDAADPIPATGDDLNAFYLGTRDALSDAGRQSITLTLDCLDAHRFGALIALFERAVGFYAELIDINAYHQPAVELGKTAAGTVIELQRKVIAHIKSAKDASPSAEEIAAALNVPESTETIHHILRHLAANAGRGFENGADE